MADLECFCLILRILDDCIIYIIIGKSELLKLLKVIVFFMYRHCY